MTKNPKAQKPEKTQKPKADTPPAQAKSPRARKSPAPAPPDHATQQPHTRARKPKAKKRRRKVRGDWKAFCAVLANGQSVTSAAEAAGVDRSYAYERRKLNKQFREAWDNAYEKGTDKLEQEAARRAMIGYDRPLFMRVGIFANGKKVGEKVEQVGTERIYSDRLMEIMLRGRRPRTFRERYDLTHAGKKGAPPIAFRDVDMKGLTNEQLNALRARLLSGDAEPAPVVPGDPDADRED